LVGEILGSVDNALRRLSVEPLQRLRARRAKTTLYAKVPFHLVECLPLFLLASNLRVAEGRPLDHAY